ncbi:MAG: exonuclease domain-containing protein [Clostridia bacterium]|nr:exonuclease domain-containing protein [Clostridia bacterium]
MIVFDLEWNQSAYAPNHRMPHEIIEIGACRVDREYRVVDTFSALIRPRLYKKLDKHIRSVTGITPEELNAGGTFQDVFADFVTWCGDDAQLVTWGRDDYPVLKRNAAFFMTPMPFDPPLDAQLVFGHACLGDPHQQMNLHAALERMELTPDVPAHRAVYDAQCTAALLAPIEKALAELEEEKRALLLAAVRRERKIAASMLRSQPTGYAYQTDALADERLMNIPCPACGRRTAFDTTWFDSGREKFIALSVCAQHGMCYGQMHFKRAQSGLLIMHQRAYAADESEAADVREKHRLYLLTPLKKRHHRLNMDDALRMKAEMKSAKAAKDGAPDA